MEPLHWWVLGATLVAIFGGLFFILYRELNEPTLKGALRKLAMEFGYKPRPSTESFAGSINDIPETERAQSDLHRAFYENTGTIAHKWRGYLEVYDRHLSRFRNTDCRILEIGVSKGGSLTIWREYFGPSAIIFGIDIDKTCSRFDGNHASVRIGSQADPEFLREVVSEMGGIDIVIDDGSHVASHQRASFEVLFPLLQKNGVYICEDLQTSYWKDTFEGGYKRSGTFIEFAKTLIDDMHADFHHHGHRVTEASRSVHGIHFYNAIVAIEKRMMPKPTHMQSGVMERA